MFIISFHVFKTLQTVFLIGLFPDINTVEVRLNNGPSENQGRVEVRKNDKELWGTVCDRNFGDKETAVVCRQLGYKYSRTDSKIYHVRLPDYVLENVNCNGNEANIGECIHGAWKKASGQCGTSSDSYASVCCSNSPEFGEIRDNIFVSHCADKWIEAEETCERNKGTLESLEGYANIIGTVGETSNPEGKGFWTKSFFTPWIWSNGCFQFADGAFSQLEFNIVNNSVQTCLQLCSIGSRPSSFVLSESFCRCITEDSAKPVLTEVVPGKCSTKCSGDSSFYCGSGAGRYWSLYSLASEDTFYKISDPEQHDRRQCAVLIDSRKLATEGCYRRCGYICGQVVEGENYLEPRLLFFKLNTYYEVVMLEARAKCSSSDKTMRLIGQTILDQDGMFSEYGNLWVDVTRQLTDVYTIYWEPANREDVSLWRFLRPTWCLATRLRNGAYIDEITSCQTMFRYVCALNQRSQTSMTSDSSANTTVPGNVTTIVIAVICSVVLVAITVIVVCYIRRVSKRSGNFSCSCCQKPSVPKPVPRPLIMYDACNANCTSDDTAEHIYSEIKDPEGNIYNEADELLEQSRDRQANTNDPSVVIEDVAKESGAVVDGPNTDIKESLKEPVTIKRSYSSPKDIAELTDCKSSEDSQDPKYIYPYDNFIRSEPNAQDSNDTSESLIKDHDNSFVTVGNNTYV